MEPKYPDVTAKLSEQEGNAFVLMGCVTKAMRRAGLPNSEIEAFRTEAIAGDYDHLLRTCMAWVNVE